MAVPHTQVPRSATLHSNRQTQANVTARAPRSWMWMHTCRQPLLQFPLSLRSVLLSYPQSGTHTRTQHSTTRCYRQHTTMRTPTRSIMDNTTAVATACYRATTDGSDTATKPHSMLPTRHLARTLTSGFCRTFLNPSGTADAIVNVCGAAVGYGAASVAVESTLKGEPVRCRCSGHPVATVCVKNEGTAPTAEGFR